MPYSSLQFDEHIVAWVRGNIPNTHTIVDLGAGAGKFAGLLPEYTMDAVEFFIPYHDHFGLREKYRKVWGLLIQDFVASVSLSEYACVIMGDVLEHMSVADAQTVVDRLYNSKIPFIIKVPFLCVQEITPEVVQAYPEITGNHLEGHVQPDLTNEVMLQRYPKLTPYIVDSTFGVYITSGK
jgi:hypothetical protein